MEKVEQRPTFIEDLYERKENYACEVLQKIKDIVRTMTIMEIEKETESNDYTKLKSLLEEAEEELFEIWF